MRKLLLFSGWVALLCAANVFAAPAQYEEGKNYAELTIPIRTRHPDKIEVTEYFSYGCPHCYQFDPTISAWVASLPADVEFDRTPAVWNKEYEVYAQTYYTAKALNVQEVAHGPLFKAIHIDHLRLGDPEAMADFFKQYGVDPLDFAKTYASFGVRASVQQAEARGRAYRSKGVPAIIVNGKYRIEGEMAGSNADMLKVADFLIAKERAAMQTGE
jgi:thiol:disulfide interchange protein DsbA